MVSRHRSGVSGDKQLAANLRDMAKLLTVAQIDEAAIYAMDPMRDKTKERLKQARNFIGKYPGFPQPRVPRKGGHVDEGIVVRKLKSKSRQRQTYRLGATRRSRFLLHLVEFGTVPHFQPNFRGGWLHPGARAHPSLLPSFDEERDKVPERFGRTIWTSIAKNILKMKKMPRR